VFAHQTFQGVCAAPNVTLRGIPTNLFGNARVISGDIHVPQVLDTGGTCWIEYVGAPYLCDFGDRYRPRVILIEDGKRIRSVPTSGPQKRLVEVQSVNELKKGSVNTKYIQPGDTLKIRIMITGDQRADWPNIKDEARQWGESNGYVVHTVNPVVLDTLRGRPDKVRGQRAKLTDEQIFKAYCNRMKLSPNQQKSGLNILRKV
jgi:hypothetical protein